MSKEGMRNDREGPLGEDVSVFSKTCSFMTTKTIV